MRAPLNLAAMSRFSISWNPFISECCKGNRFGLESKKGEFVILCAKKVHYGIEKPKFTFIIREKKAGLVVVDHS